MSKEASEIQHSEFGITGSWWDSEFGGTAAELPSLVKEGCPEGGVVGAV
ncbi:MAG: hypothetical protein ACLQVL_10280 [Terriglobia bacterium]